MANDATTARPGVAPAGTSGLKMILTMGSLGLVCGVLIVAAYQLTLPRIEVNKARALERAVFEVIPNATTKAVFAEKDGRLVPADEAPGSPLYYAGYDDAHHLVGVAVEASGQGFADLLHLIYGYSPGSGAVVGMKVLESHETPGLGSKIDSDPSFRANFDSLAVRTDDAGTGIRNPVALAKHGEKTEPWQVEAITGATISSRAVTNILRASTERTVPIIMKNLDTLEGGGQ